MLLAILALLTADPSPDAALHVADRLDLRSFRNSTGPRRQAHLRTPADYGFTHVEATRDGVELWQEDRSWFISLRVVSQDAQGSVVCFHDRAMNGGSYNTEQALRVSPEADGLYRALPEQPIIPGCKRP